MAHKSDLLIARKEIALPGKKSHCPGHAGRGFVAACSSLHPFRMSSMRYKLGNKIAHLTCVFDQPKSF